MMVWCLKNAKDGHHDRAGYQQTQTEDQPARMFSQSCERIGSPASRPTLPIIANSSASIRPMTPAVTVTAAMATATPWCRTIETPTTTGGAADTFGRIGADEFSPPAKHAINLDR